MFAIPELLDRRALVRLHAMQYTLDEGTAGFQHMWRIFSTTACHRQGPASFGQYGNIGLTDY